MSLRRMMRNARRAVNYNLAAQLPQEGETVGQAIVRGTAANIAAANDAAYTAPDYVCSAQEAEFLLSQPGAVRSDDGNEA